MRLLGLWLTVCVAMVLCSVPCFAFRDDFDSLDTSRWTSFERGGTITVEDGRLCLSTGYSSRFPFMYLNHNPFPGTGSFTVSMGIRFSFVTPAGTGVMTDVAVPSYIGNYHTSKVSVNSPFQWWADTGGFSYSGITGQPSGQLSWHDTVYHVITCAYDASGIVTLRVDGVTRASYPGPRPAVIWLGNPSEFESQSVNWSSFELDYIEVLPDPVPEPSSLLAIVLGIGGLGMAWRRSGRRLR